MKRQSVYAKMTASDLARITRDRGLEKPGVKTLSEWADFLEADDINRQSASSSPEFEIVEAESGEPILGYVVEPEKANSLANLVSALALKAGVDITPVDFADEAPPLFDQLEQQLAAIAQAGDDNTVEATANSTVDGDRDTEDADPNASLPDSDSPTPPKRPKVPTPKKGS